MKYKTDWLDVFVYFSLTMLIIVGAGVLVYSLTMHEKTITENCKKECNKFDYEFYKIESGNLFETSKCWCLDENSKPKNIGSVNDK